MHLFQVLLFTYINQFQNMKRHSFLYLILCLLCWINIAQQDRIFRIIDFLRKNGNISLEQQLQEYQNDSKKNIWKLSFSKQQIIKQFLVRENFKTYEIAKFSIYEIGSKLTPVFYNRNRLHLQIEELSPIQMGRSFYEYNFLQPQNFGIENFIYGSIANFPKKLHKNILQLFSGKRSQNNFQQQKQKPTQKFSSLIKSPLKPQIKQSQNRQQFIQYKHNTPYPIKNQLYNPILSNKIFSKQTISNTPSLNMLLSPLKAFQHLTIDDKDDLKMKDQHSDAQCQSDLEDLETYDSDLQDVQSKTQKIQEDKDQTQEQFKDQNLLAEFSQNTAQKSKESQQKNINQQKKVVSEIDTEKCEKDCKKQSILISKNSFLQDKKQK